MALQSPHFRNTAAVAREVEDHLTVVVEEHLTAVVAHLAALEVEAHLIVPAAEDLPITQVATAEDLPTTTQAAMEAETMETQDPSWLAMARVPAHMEEDLDSSPLESQHRLWCLDQSSSAMEMET